jgi:hypothetical protein
VVVGLTQRFRSKPARGSDTDVRAQQDAVRGDFDPVFYAVRYPEVTGDLLEHYMASGWREGRDPAPWFSTADYLESNPDVAAAGLNPFYHYVQHGRAEGRPAVAAEARADDRSWEIAAIRKGIDEPYYAGQLRQLGIEADGVDLALHYWREGAGLGLDPAPDFSTAYYLTAHADVAAHGVNPFAHYLEQGQGEGRSTRPAEVTAAADGPDDRALAAGAFDPTYYLAAYPDVAAAGVDPLDHFLAAGWREGRDPNAGFSVGDYLDAYPDVAEAGINPFLHYLMAGKAEGRAPRHELGFRYGVIKSLKSLDERVVHARQSAPRRRASSVAALANALDDASRLEAQGLYISVSHDDFTENFGGVQLVLMRESAAVDALGYDHLHLFPAVPLPIAELDDGDPLIGVLLNRKRVGFLRASAIARELERVASRLGSAPFAIHSLIGHNAEALIAILNAAGCKRGWYWVHDYSSACTGYTLLRNDVEFCGAPPPASTACSICVYGGLRAEQMKAHQQLFEAFDLTVIAPSDAALDVWKAGTALLAPAKVHEHLKITAGKGKKRSRKEPAERPLRIAYVGQPVVHKGWPVFRELAIRFGEDPRYRFYHVGKDPQAGVPATFEQVVVGAADLDAMVRTLERLEIDVVLQWSLWPETFCIAAVEALRAGAALLTFKDSGNVAAMVRKTGLGKVLDDEEELTRLFESGAVIELARACRPAGLMAEFSNMTADFIGSTQA